MKWMGWSWAEFESAPVTVVERIIELIHDEQREFEELRSRSRRR